jgi:hypothetical protein
LKHLVALTVLVLLSIVFAPDLLAQYESEKDASIPLENFYIERRGPGLRRLLSKLTFGFSTGYSNTKFIHELPDFNVRQPASGEPMIFQTAPNGYSNWFNKVETTTSLPAGTDFLAADNDLGFKSNAFQIPLRATLHVEFQRFRIGGGYAFEFTHLGDFKPLTLQDQIGSFSPGASTFFMKKYFGSFGASVYRYENYLLVVDANIGGYKLGKKFDSSLIDRSLFFNVGVAVEREMSEYFRLFIRPSYDVKSFSINIPETGNAIKHKVNALYINVGATYRIPELRRCFIRNCRAQLNHAHGDREYRSRVHPIYKKQNPHYGENYPTLIKYKGKNKKKLNPY